MSKKTFSLLLVLAIGLFSFGAVAAQDATATPETGNVEVITTLEDLTANSDNYVGQSVTVEGVIEELINVRTFVLGEGAALDDDKVLVINNSGREFDLNITKDQQLRLEATVYPSIDNGGLDQIVGMNPMTETMEPAAMVTETPMDETMMTEEAMVTEMPMDEAMMTEEATDTTVMPPTPLMDESMSDTTMGDHMYDVDFSQMGLPDGYNGYTILVLNSLDTITYIERR